MTILSMVQAVCDELGEQRPSSVISSTNETARQLQILCQREGKTVRSRFKWPELTKEYTFDLTSGTANYALPTDFDEFIFETHWDRDQTWELHGPLSPQEWQMYKSGIVSLSPRRRYRIKGFADAQFYIDPTPGSGDTGDTLVFEYQTKNWCRPRTWATGVSYGAGTYTFYNGNYYSTTAGGTTGATPPTHTTGTASDGTVSWIYYSGIYETFLADTDVPHLDEELITMGLLWRFAQAKGIDYSDYRREYEAFVNRKMVAKRGARTLDLAGPQGIYPLIGPWNLPDGGYGS